ncbi:DNA polymerase III subunit gamma/tau [Pinibacter aurantiacus]|uniref:DNA polymerase III subunit gamma/tau n=1 Tax=Pinibacter aurantiacus TaxID=2851599 RepID=A0A9E2S7G9_9BACT|nr:DNA polymerase III subunit gamma/tau [Pinibacter aurantiacus]MBV4358028.1 DNA polymerase III subunit gamma/tau [Pinibacter aurantiacus]
MDKFIVSARKYRPQNFSTVVGQSHITTTLKNAIKNQQLAHAFLFCGPRGVGKTTCARILAKTINCENPTPDGEACNECHSCVSFNEGTSLNIHELDAASNNSVDDIRALVEQVRFAPQAGKYKVYIVDEVHMLSASAFNAFLKTLEEPPPYAIFILATTEKHKILPTILSRCQIFDFKRITINDTVDHLAEICEKEEINADKAALQVIAQKSEGCMRDSLSILDKIVSFTNGELTYQNTLEHLNILDADYYFKMVDCMLEQDLAGAMLLYDDINRKGFEGDLVLNGFAEFLRNLLVCKDAKVAGLLEVVQSFRDRYTATAQKVSIPYIISALNALNEAEINYKAARNKRLHVELLLIKLCYLQQALELASSGDGISKKKIAESTRPVAFKNLKIVELKIASGVESTPQMPPAAQGGAKLIIEEPQVQYKAPTPQPQQPAAMPAPAAKQAATPQSGGGKLGSLSKMRQQFTGGDGNSAMQQAIPLTQSVLEEVWRNFSVLLKEGRNPAAQSFDLAVLRIKSDASFEIVTPNNLQQKFIEGERVGLSEYLQEKFCNRRLTYNVIVELNEDLIPKVEMPLTSKEQFQKIAEEYPAVKELRDRLRLELDL